MEVLGFKRLIYQITYVIYWSNLYFLFLNWPPFPQDMLSTFTWTKMSAECYDWINREKSAQQCGTSLEFYNCSHD